MHPRRPLTKRVEEKRVEVSRRGVDGIVLWSCVRVSHRSSIASPQYNILDVSAQRKIRQMRCAIVGPLLNTLHWNGLATYPAPSVRLVGCLAPQTFLRNCTYKGIPCARKIRTPGVFFA